MHKLSFVHAFIQLIVTMVSLVPVIVLITLGCVATHPVVENTAKEKYTKEHITSELQKTDLEPAMLMEYLAQLMGKNPGSGQCEFECLPVDIFSI